MNKEISAVAIILMAISSSAEAQFEPFRGMEGTNLPTTSLVDILRNILQYGLTLLTILGVIGFVISGLTFIVAGALGKGETARNWLIYSIVGIVVGLSGYIIIRLISNLLLGQTDV